MSRLSPHFVFAFGLLAVLVTTSPASAAETGGPLFGTLREYWRGFVDFWAGAFLKQNGIVMLVLGLGAVGIFIITRGKWKK
jgi:hypothetical protein